MINVLLICNAGAEYGLGHLSRMLVLEAALLKRSCFNVEFALLGDDIPRDRVKTHNSYFFSHKDDLGKCVVDITKNQNFRVVVFDLHPDTVTKCFHELLLKLKDINIRLIGIDGFFDYSKVFDLLWIPSFTLDKGKLESSKCTIKFGWDCFLIKRRLSLRDWIPGKKLLVLTGGSDTMNMYETLPGQLDSNLNDDFEIHWVQGPLSSRPNIPEQSRHNWHLYLSPIGLDELILDSNYVLTIFGVSLFEVLQYGIPAVVFSPYGKKDAIELDLLARENVAGVASNSVDAIHMVNALKSNTAKAQQFSANALKKLQSNGAANLVNQIYNLLGE